MQLSPRPLLLALLASGVALSGCGSSSSSSSSSASRSSSSSASASAAGRSQLGFEGVPIEAGAPVAPASSTGTTPIHGITCGASEQLAYHIHAHLAIYVNGQARSLPGGIGIPASTTQQSPQGPVAVGGQCIYWLHTHAPDGIVHVESPTQRVYTLGEFFDEWRQPLSANSLGTATGHVTAFVDGKPWTRSPRLIPLKPHSVIQLDVGSPATPFQPMSWTGLQL